MLSKIPVDLQDISDENIDKEILRVAIIAELDAINLYEQMASLTKKRDIKKILMDVAKEEKTHVGEFQALLLRFDTQQKKELEAGAEESGGGIIQIIPITRIPKFPWMICEKTRLLVLFCCSSE